MKMRGFRFGLEAEFLLARKSDLTPLWHKDISFTSLNSILERIPLDGTGGLEGLELEPPHRKLMPYVVEGYHVPDQDFAALDINPKGVEIRTPVASSLDECLRSFDILLARLQSALAEENLVAVALSHHPLESKFTGPQNKRRHDFWQWAMEVMTTYGPDINIAVPTALQNQLDIADLESKIDHYGPALAALSVASPFANGGLWDFRGRDGLSYRMFKRSVIAPPIEIHPDEDWRLEFKVFDMPKSTRDFRCMFLSFLGLLLTPELRGRGSKQSRIYDLGQVSRFGLKAESVSERLTELFEMAPPHLAKWGFDPSPLEHFRARLIAGRTPADDMIETYIASGRQLRAVLHDRSVFEKEAIVDESSTRTAP
jgi:carboxylate-amine ligase